MYFQRHLEDSLRRYQQIFPIIAILDHCQYGKNADKTTVFSLDEFNLP
jgi:hypothetical protein